MSDNTMPEMAPRDRPRRRWPTVLLALSLTMNLAVIGLVAGAHLRDDRDTRRFPPPDRAMLSDAGLRPFFEAMPREARVRLGAELRTQSGMAMPDREELAAELGDMLAIMRADPYDRAAFEALLAAQHQRVEARLAAGRGALAGQIAAMSASQRQEFADRLEARFSQALGRGPASHDAGTRAPGRD
jgi:uncharacterized membrane protein